MISTIQKRRVETILPLLKVVISDFLGISHSIRV